MTPQPCSRPRTCTRTRTRLRRSVGVSPPPPSSGPGSPSGPAEPRAWVGGLRARLLQSEGGREPGGSRTRVGVGGGVPQVCVGRGGRAARWLRGLGAPGDPPPRRPPGQVIGEIAQKAAPPPPPWLRGPGSAPGRCTNADFAGVSWLAGEGGRFISHPGFFQFWSGEQSPGLGGAAWWVRVWV